MNVDPNPYTHDGMSGRNALYRENSPDNDFVNLRDQYRQRGWDNELPLYDQGWSAHEKRAVIGRMIERLKPLDIIAPTDPLHATFVGLWNTHRTLFLRHAELMQRRQRHVWQHRHAEQMSPIPGDLLVVPEPHPSPDRATQADIDAIRWVIRNLEERVSRLNGHLDQQAAIGTAFEENPALQALLSYTNKLHGIADATGFEK